MKNWPHSENNGADRDSPGRMRGWIHARLSQKTLMWPEVYTMHLTDKCNHHCPFCYFARSSKESAVHQVLSVLDFLLSKGTLREVVVSGGGEPLLHRDIRKVFDRLSELSRIERRLYTNGSLIIRHVRNILEAFDYVRISLDAGNRKDYAKIHGTPEGDYDRILDAAGELGAEGAGHPHIALSVVVTEQNQLGISGLIKDAEARGIFDVLLKPTISNAGAAYPQGFGTFGHRPIGLFRRRTVQNPIPAEPSMPAGIAAMNLLSNADGFLYPCCHLLSDDRRIAPTDVEALAAVWDTPAHWRILQNYAQSNHTCRAHSAWHRYNLHEA